MRVKFTSLALLLAGLLVCFITVVTSTSDNGSSNRNGGFC